MAAKAHELYNDAHPYEGYQDYPLLKESTKNSNRSQVKYMPELLDTLGICIGLLDGPEEETSLTEEEIWALSPIEHERWMGEKISSKFKFGDGRNNRDKVHHDLVPWDKLTREEQLKDYEAISRYSILLRCCEPPMKMFRRKSGLRNSYEEQGAANIPIIFSVTGHTDIKDREGFKESVAKLFRDMHKLYRYTDLVLLSALADGADQLAADAALENYVRVAPVMPFDIGEYRETISDKDAFDRILGQCTIKPLTLHPSETVGCWRNLSTYLVTHSHMLIAGWDGYEYLNKRGGTYDTVRIACLGLDADTVEENMKRKLETLEDMPVFWYQADRRGGEGRIGTALNKRSDFIIPTIIRETKVGKGEDTVIRFPHTEDLENIDEGQSEKDEKEMILPYLPRYYRDIFKHLDDFNKAAGTEGDERIFIHRCRKSTTRERVDLDEAYSLGTKGQNPEWMRSRCGLNYSYDLENNTDGSSMDLVLTSPVLQKIHLRRQADATAMRYDLVGRMYDKNVRRSNRVLIVASLLCILTTLLLGLFMLSGTSLLFIIFYAAVAVIGQCILDFRYRARAFENTIEYRCLQQCLRTRYFLALIGRSDSLYMSYYDHKRNNSMWIRAALLSWDAYFMNDRVKWAEGDVKHRDLLNFLKMSWPFEDWSKFKERNQQTIRSACWERRFRGALLGVIICMAVAEVLLLLFEPDTFSPKVIEGWAYRQYSMVADITMDDATAVKVVLLALVSTYTGILAWYNHGIASNIDQNNAAMRMFEISIGRIEAIEREIQDTEDATLEPTESEKAIMKVYEELGDQCIRDCCEWVLFNKSRKLRAISLGSM